MTLSLDDVRNKRFRMARKSGYEVLEVDEFVDEVEEAFASLVEENASLKKQVDALRSGDGHDDRGAPDTPARDTAADQAPQSAPAASSGEPDTTAAERIVVTASPEASTAVVRLVQLSTEQAERLVAEADQEASRIRDDASRNAERVTGDARAQAEQLQADAVGRAEELDRELATRRTSMFGELEQQRDTLTQTVASLRAFEENYRSSLADHLRRQLDSLDQVSLEPAGGPEQPASPTDGSRSPEPTDVPDDTDPPPVGGGSVRSDTPRLDALLGDQG